MPGIWAALITIFVTAGTGNEPFEPVPTNDVLDETRTAIWSNQLLTLICSVGISILSGFLTGALMRIPGRVENIF